MAKMFYTAEEAAQKLSMSADKVREMAASGQLQEFRDRDKLVFKREQVDMLAGDAGGTRDGADGIPLADSGEMISLAEESKADLGAGSLSGTTKDRSGISIFEGDESDESDASAQTQVTASVGGMTVGDPSGSGSGLLDLTRDGGDSALGANLLEDVYDNRGNAPSDIGAGLGDSRVDNALFENQGVASDVGGGLAGAGAGLALVAAEPYDGSWSGITGGLAVAMIAIFGTLIAVVTFGLTGYNNSGLLTTMSANMWAFVGGFGALAAIGAIGGWLLGRKS